MNKLICGITFCCRRSPPYTYSTGSLFSARPGATVSCCWRGSASSKGAVGIMLGGKRSKNRYENSGTFFKAISLNSNAFINWQPDRCLTSFKNPDAFLLLWWRKVSSCVFHMCQHQFFLCACLKIHTYQGVGEFLHCDKTKLFLRVF